MRVALSAYAGPMPRRVVPIWRFPSLRSRAPSRATCHGMIRWAFPETNTRPSVRCPRDSSSSSSPIRTSGSTTQPAPIALATPVTMPDGMARILYVSPSTTIVWPAFGPALVAAHEVGLLGEQVDDLAFPLVAPLRPDDHGRGHVAHSRTRRSCRVRRRWASLPPCDRAESAGARARGARRTQYGAVALVHCRMSALGTVVGGAETVVRALLDTVGLDGTLVHISVGRTRAD